MASLWDQILDNITPDSPETLTKPLIAGAERAAQIADRITPDPQKSKPVYQAGQGVVSYATGETNPLGKAYEIATSPLRTPVAIASQALLALDNAISRPASVALQATYKNNPLYRDGLQLQDFVDMWNASETLSPGMVNVWRSVDAAGYSAPIAGIVNPSLMLLGGPGSSPQRTFETNNIYDPARQAELQNNTLWALTTGVSDAAFQLAAGKGIDSLANLGRKAIGLNTVIDNARDLAKLRKSAADHIVYTETGGAAGKRSTFGYWMDKAAATTDEAALRQNPLFKYSPNVDKLVNTVAGVSDARTVGLIALADRGDRVAIATLLKSDPDFVWSMGMMTERLQKQLLESGADVRLTPDIAPVVERVFNAPLERQPTDFYRRARDLFLEVGDDTKGMYDTMAGTQTRSVPMEGIPGRIQARMMQTADNVRMGRPIYEAPENAGWLTTQLGNAANSEPVTVLLQWSGARRPEGMASLSPNQPSDLIDELLSQAGRLAWTRGKRAWTFKRDGLDAQMTGPQWRQEAISRLTRAADYGDLSRNAALQELESELISSVMLRFNLTVDQANELTKAVMAGKKASMDQVKDIGFWFDDEAKLVRVDPAFRRQLPDTYVFFPIEQFAMEARRLSSPSGMAKGLRSARHSFDQLYELVQKYVRINQLLRFAYTPKNAIAEPTGAGIADRGILSVGDVAVDATKGFRNFMVNSAKRAGSAAYWVGDRLHVGKGYQFNKELANLHQEAAVLRDQMDAATAMQQTLESGVRSPAEVAKLKPRVDAELLDLTRQYERIKARLDVDDPNWQSLLEAPSLRQLTDEVAEVEAILDDPLTATRLAEQVQLRSDIEATRYAERVAGARTKIAANQARIEQIDAQIEYSKDPVLPHVLDQQKSIQQRLTGLRILEQRLAWAERVAREGVQDNAGSARKKIADQIARLETERADEQIRLSVGTQDMLTSVTPASKRLERIDRQIEELQARLSDLQVVSGGIPYTAQQVLDEYPSQIAQLRQSLGQFAPARSTVDDAVEKEFLDEINAVQGRMREAERATKAEISQLEAETPPMTLINDQPSYVVTDSERKTLRTLAERQYAEELANEEALYHARKAPGTFGELELSSIQMRKAEKDGLVPMKWVLDMLENKPVTIRSRVVKRKTPDGQLVPTTVPGRTINKPRGDLTLDEFALWLKTGYVDRDAARAAGVLPEYVEIPGPGEIRQLAELSGVGRDRTEYVRLPWMTSKVTKEDRIEQIVDDLVFQYEEQAGLTFERNTAQIDQLRAELDEQLAGDREWLDTLRGYLDEHRAGKETPKRVAYVMEDPLPGPYNVRLLEREREALLRDTEQAKRVTELPYTDSDRLRGMRKQLDRAQKLAGADEDTLAMIRGLRAQLTVASQARMAVGQPMNPAAELDRLAEQLKGVYDRIGVIRNRTLPTRERRARLRELKRSGEGTTTFEVGGSKLVVPDWYAKDSFGEATRAELSASYTNRATFDPTLTGIANAQRIADTHKTVEVFPDSPMYFEELAYAANRHVTGDPMAAKLLTGASDADMMKWFASPEGMKYMRDMQWEESPVLSRIVGAIKDQTTPDKTMPLIDRSFVGNARQMLFRYFPTEQARKAVLEGEVTPTQFERALAEIPTSELSPVMGRAMETILQEGVVRGYARKFLDWAWDKLATNPENVLARFPVINRWMDDEATIRLQMLAEQGVKPTLEDFNAIRQSVIAAGVREARRTFYNTTRMNNWTYAARYLLVYPQAVFNTLWRAGRLTYNKPGTAMVMNNTWTSFFTTHGVDADGNPTKDYSKVEYLLFNVPKWAKDFGVDDQLRLPAKSFELVSDRIGATWTVQVPLQTLIMYKPSTNEALKAVLGDSYKTIFPFGTPSGLSDTAIAGIPAGAVVPNYVRSLINAFTMDTDQFVRVWNQVTMFDLAAYEQKLKTTPETILGPKPTLESTSKKAWWYWILTAAAQFSITGGGGLQPSGGIEMSQIRKIIQKNDGDREKALPEIQQQFPDLDAQTILTSTSQYNSYIPSTVEAYSMATDASLQPLISTVVANIGGGDPEFASLLFADKNGAFDANVYDALGNMTLPGSTVPVRERMPTEQVFARAQAQKSWEIYNASRTALMAEVQRRGLRSVPDDLQAAWDKWFYGDNETPGFADKPENQYMLAQLDNRNYGEARQALNTLTLGLDDPAMAKYRDTPYWKTVASYLDNVARVQDAYKKAAGNGALRDQIAAEWDAWVNTTYGARSPEFILIYNKHLQGHDFEVK